MCLHHSTQLIRSQLVCTRVCVFVLSSSPWQPYTLPGCSGNESSGHPVQEVRASRSLCVCAHMSARMHVYLCTACRGWRTISGALPQVLSTFLVAVVLESGSFCGLELAKKKGRMAANEHQDLSPQSPRNRRLCFSKVEEESPTPKDDLSMVTTPSFHHHHAKFSSEKIHKSHE